MIECKIVYFEEPGKKNTEDVFRIARQRAEELSIKTILVASISGETAVKAMDAFKGFKVVVVTHNTGYMEPNSQQFTEENAKLVHSKGGILLTTTSAFGGLSRAMGQSSLLPPGATYVIGDIVANALRVFGQGMKVACEIASMAADSGLVRTDEEVISIAGTNLRLGETARGGRYRGGYTASQCASILPNSGERDSLQAPGTSPLLTMFFSLRTGPIGNFRKSRENGRLLLQPQD